MSNPIPHLHRDRLGTFYFRITVAGRTVKKSLRTKDAQLATMRAARLNWELPRMPPSREPTVTDILKAHEEGRTRAYDVKLPSGVEINGIESEEDSRRAMELLGKLPPSAFAAPPSAAPAPHLPPAVAISSGRAPVLSSRNGIQWKCGLLHA